MIFKPIIRYWNKRKKKMIKHQLKMINKSVGINPKWLGGSK